MLMAEKERRESKEFFFISSKGGYGINIVPISTEFLIFVLTQDKWRHKFPITPNRYFFFAQIESNRFFFSYLAPGKYMDPSMNTEPHSKTYQQEHNSPRLQNEKKRNQDDQ